jgi:hypothetical protein
MTAGDILVAYQGQQVDIFVCPPMAAGDNLGFSTMRVLYVIPWFSTTGSRLILWCVQQWQQVDSFVCSPMIAGDTFLFPSMAAG